MARADHPAHFLRFRYRQNNQFAGRPFPTRRVCDSGAPLATASWHAFGSTQPISKPFSPLLALTPLRSRIGVRASRRANAASLPHGEPPQTIFADLSIWTYVFRCPSVLVFFAKTWMPGKSALPVRMRRPWTRLDASFQSTGTDEIVKIHAGHTNSQASNKSRNSWPPFKTSTLRPLRHRVISIVLTKTYV